MVTIFTESVADSTPEEGDHQSPPSLGHRSHGDLKKLPALCFTTGKPTLTFDLIHRLALSKFGYGSEDTELYIVVCLHVDYNLYNSFKCTPKCSPFTLFTVEMETDQFTSLTKFREHVECIKHYLTTGRYLDGLSDTVKRTVRKATAAGQYFLEGRSISFIQDFL